jgi:hypothetical protein
MVAVEADSTAEAVASAALAVLVAREASAVPAGSTVALADSAAPVALAEWVADFLPALRHSAADLACRLVVSPDLVALAEWATDYKALKDGVLAWMDSAAELALTSADLAITLPSPASAARVGMAVRAKACVRQPTAQVRVRVPINSVTFFISTLPRRVALALDPTCRPIDRMHPARKPTTIPSRLATQAIIRRGRTVRRNPPQRFKTSSAA